MGDLRIDRDIIEKAVEDLLTQEHGVEFGCTTCKKGIGQGHSCDGKSKYFVTRADLDPRYKFWHEK